MAEEDIKEVLNEQAQSEELSEVEVLKKDLAEAKDKSVRLLAEFENMRKRTERERIELIKYAHEEVIIELLGFYEDLERTLSAAKANPNEAVAIVKGLGMVMSRFQQLLKKYDVREIEAVGKKFDHERHEALMTEESADHDDHTILEVFQKGYTLGGRVVKTAKVKVSKKPESVEDKKEE